MCLPLCPSRHSSCFFFFFFNDTATTEIYTLSLHDALPISRYPRSSICSKRQCCAQANRSGRSEEHTSELQSLTNLVCRLLLEKKKNNLCMQEAEHPHRLPVRSSPDDASSI